MTFDIPCSCNQDAGTHERGDQGWCRLTYEPMQAGGRRRLLKTGFGRWTKLAILIAWIAILVGVVWSTTVRDWPPVVYSWCIAMAVLIAEQQLRNRA